MSEDVDRAVAAQRMEYVEHADAIRDAAVYGVGWIKYVWDHQAQRARPVRVHPETVADRDVVAVETARARRHARF